MRTFPLSDLPQIKKKVYTSWLRSVMWPLRFASLGTCRAAGHAAACLALCFSLPPTYLERRVSCCCCSGIVAFWALFLFRSRLNRLSHATVWLILFPVLFLVKLRSLPYFGRFCSVLLLAAVASVCDEEQGGPFLLRSGVDL